MYLRLLLFLCVLLSANPLFGQDCALGSRATRAAKVFVRRVVFENATILGLAERQNISAGVRKSEGLVSSQTREELATLAEEADERLRAAYQNKGYFKVETEGTLVPVAGVDKSYFDVVLRVLRKGGQYRMGDLRFVHAVLFSDPELRELFPVERGEICDRETLAKGLEAVRRLYDSRGYINFTGIPSTDFDDERGIANLTVDIDEGPQFRLRTITVLGLDTATEKQIKDSIEMKPGDVYTPAAWERAVQNSAAHVDARDPFRVSKSVEAKDGWVDITLDVRRPRPCPIDLSTPTTVELNPGA